MISDKMQKALNEQINAELFSSYLYLAMSAYFESENWQGFSKWMQVQSQEEYSHAMKIFKYLNDVDSKVLLDSIEKPKLKWKSPLEVFEESLKHELYITERINTLVGLAIQEKDYSTNLFLNYFVNEQVEEVSSVTQIVNKFKLLNDNKTSLFFLDRELGMRAK